MVVLAGYTIFFAIVAGILLTTQINRGGYVGDILPQMLFAYGVTIVCIYCIRIALRQNKED